MVIPTDYIPFLQQNLFSLLDKGAIEHVPRKSVRLLQIILFSTQEGQGSVSDFRSATLNHTLRMYRFKMLTLKLIVSQITSEDWFAKDAYVHIEIQPEHGKFLRFAFGGKAYKHCVSPFGSALFSTQLYRQLAHFSPFKRADNEMSCLPIYRGLIFLTLSNIETPYNSWLCPLTLPSKMLCN